MTSEKQMKAFLQQNGWKWSKARMHWWTTKPGYWFGGLEYCYRIAKRRKDARDRAKLKKAGWCNYGMGWGSRTADRHCLTRAEALATLEALGQPQAGQ